MSKYIGEIDICIYIDMYIKCAFPISWWVCWQRAVAVADLFRKLKAARADK